MKKINKFLALLGRHDFGTLIHCRSVAGLMGEWARDMDFSENEARKAYACGLLHDIGKLHISSQILNKPERLSANEWITVKKHPAYGCNILNSAGLPEISNIIRYHHERYDGTGYGEGLKMEQIPFLSRMLAVCDTFDAMTGNRCYTQTVSSKQALLEIEKCAGSQFDPILAVDFICFVVQGKKHRYNFDIL